MKKVINGSRYDTDTAKRLGVWESDQDYTGLSHVEETLYRTKAGKYFLHGCGNAASAYAVHKSDGWSAPGEKIIPLSDAAARQWAEQHLDADAVELAFGPSSGSADTQATVYIPDVLARKLAARMAAERCSRNELILRALQEYLK